MERRTHAAIGHFEICLPPFHQSQADLVSWTVKCHATAARVSDPETNHAEQDVKLDLERIEKLFRRYGISPEKIRERYFECPDIQSSSSWRENKIYNFSNGQAEGVSIKARTEFFAERADAVFAEFYPSPNLMPNHLIHVTCTGYVSPSAAQLLAARFPGTAVTHAYHMGCYASLPAVRIAESLVQAAGLRDPQTAFKADIVHTEMCGLHMNAALHTPEQIVMQTLFADGHIKYSVRSEAAFTEGFRILKVHEEVIPDTAGDMRWTPSEWGMQMSLSREVPEKIAASLRSFLERFLKDYDFAEILKSAIFAIHPGGPKIVESVQSILELSVAQTIASEAILHERGNMSSATLPHVWQRILQSKPSSGTKVVSLAFGPGLTLLGALFECL
jgi:predicted naringenin-chalcone synthase